MKNGGHKVEKALWTPGMKSTVAKLPALCHKPAPSDTCVPETSPCGACERCGHRAAMRVCAEALRGEWAYGPTVIDVGTMSQPDETITVSGLIDVLRMLGLAPEAADNIKDTDIENTDTASDPSEISAGPDAIVGNVHTGDGTSAKDPA